jgi:hypothetical protein
MPSGARAAPCTAVVEERVAYRFNLLTHCGVEWAYFDGRFWVPSPKVNPPSDWANIEAGVMRLVDAEQAVFEADDELVSRGRRAVR